jgi:hypothetical protein
MVPEAEASRTEGEGDVCETANPKTQVSLTAVSVVLAIFVVLVATFMYLQRPAQGAGRKKSTVHPIDAHEVAPPGAEHVHSELIATAGIKKPKRGLTSFAMPTHMPHSHDMATKEDPFNLMPASNVPRGSRWEAHAPTAPRRNTAAEGNPFGRRPLPKAPRGSRWEVHAPHNAASVFTNVVKASTDDTDPTHRDSVDSTFAAVDAEQRRRMLIEARSRLSAENVLNAKLMNRLSPIKRDVAAVSAANAFAGAMHSGPESDGDNDGGHSSGNTSSAIDPAQRLQTLARFRLAADQILDAKLMNWNRLTTKIKNLDKEASEDFSDQWL